MNFNKFIGLPYKNMGRDFDGVDCIGLGILIYKTVLNKTFPDFSDVKYSQDWYKNSENHLIYNIDQVLTPINPPYKRFDGLLLYNGTKVVVNHIGFWIGDGKFIHIYEGTTSRVDRLSGYWESKLHKAVRLKES